MSSNLLRSTPLRITVLFGVAFIVAMLLAGLVAWQLTGRELATRLDTSIAEDFAIISQTFNANDIVDLRDSVASHASATVDHNRIYLLRSTNGAVLAGNVDKAGIPLGWSEVPAAALGMAGAARYRVFSSAVAGNPLLVGASLEETEAIGRLVMSSLAVAALLLTLILVGFGLMLARRGQLRLDEVSEVMRQVGAGQLGARIRVSRRADDIDAVAEQVNGALDRLAGLVEGMRQVSVDIAHDLKTPLNRLSITIADASGAAAGTALAPLLLQAEGEIEQIDATFEALLRIAQIEAGSRRIRFLLISIGPLLTSLADIYSDVAEDNKQSLSIDIAQDLPLVGGDRELLTQLFVNLIENAIRHSAQGSAIRISATSTADNVAVDVADRGPGIPAIEREAVFRRLYRLDRSRSTPGSGLGLSLVKAIADLHGATVILEDNSPGLRATVRFPRGDLGT